jgi:hypothetical protein
LGWALLRVLGRRICRPVNKACGRKNESYAEFILRFKQNPIAKKIRLADLRDNMDLRRLSEATEEDFARYRKYENA